MPEELLNCYNKGCGQSYKAKENAEDSCTYHPGVPVFHDAYKGWSCCRKKCTDFTEFLNIKGCTVSFHSNEKPPEPEKPEKSDPAEVVVVRAPEPVQMQRPPFDEPLKTIKPTISTDLIQQFSDVVVNKTMQASDAGEVAIGTACKHGGCLAVYKGAGASMEPCDYHSGLPVFHEGLKYWSCCKKRTTDFTEFLNQVGCVRGDHQWIVGEGARSKPICRHDWYQTSNLVIITIYAKKYDPYKSIVEINAIRAKINIVFPQDSSEFSLDIELRGIIDVDQCEVNMMSSKVEISLRKAEPGLWNNLEFPSQKVEAAPKPEPIYGDLFDECDYEDDDGDYDANNEDEDDDDDPVDLGDI